MGVNLFIDLSTNRFVAGNSPCVGLRHISLIEGQEYEGTVTFFKDGAEISPDSFVLNLNDKNNNHVFRTADITGQSYSLKVSSFTLRNEISASLTLPALLAGSVICNEELFTITPVSATITANPNAESPVLADNVYIQGNYSQVSGQNVSIDGHENIVTAGNVTINGSTEIHGDHSSITATSVEVYGDDATVNSITTAENVFVSGSGNQVSGQNLYQTINYQSSINGTSGDIQIVPSGDIQIATNGQNLSIGYTAPNPLAVEGAGDIDVSFDGQAYTVSYESPAPVTISASGDIGISQNGNDFVIGYDAPAVDLSKTVQTTGRQTIQGVKTFTDILEVDTLMNTNNAGNERVIELSSSSLVTRDGDHSLDWENRNLQGPWTAQTPTSTNHITNKTYVDSQFLDTVRTTGNQTASGQKIFANGARFGSNPDLYISLNHNVNGVLSIGTNPFTTSGLFSINMSNGVVDLTTLTSAQSINLRAGNLAGSQPWSTSLTPTGASNLVNKSYIDGPLSNLVKATGNQTISGQKTFATPIVCSYIYATYNFNDISLNDGNLYAGGSVSLNWLGRLLINAAGNTSLNWDDGILYSNNTDSIDWVNRQLIDSDGFSVLNWSNRTLIESAGGATTLNWGELKLYDLFGNQAIEWNSRNMYDAGGNLAGGWGDRNLMDGSEVVSIDWNNRSLIDENSDEIATWNDGKFYAVEVDTNSIKAGKFINSVQTFSGSATISASFVTYTGSGGHTFTLPSVAGNSGMNITIKNKTANSLTISRAGSDGIFDNGPSTVTTVTINGGGFMTLICDGVDWCVVNK